MGSPVIDWSEKFSLPRRTSFAPFQVGEEVVVRCIVSSAPDRTRELRADARPWCADRFVLVEGSRTIEGDDGRPLTALLRIMEAERREFASRWSYRAALLDVLGRPPVNPGKRLLEELPEGARIRLDGVLVRFEAEEAGEWTPTFQYGRVLTDDGEEHLIDLPAGGLVYSGSEGRMDGVEQGARISFYPRIIRSKRYPGPLLRGIDGGTRLEAWLGDPCFRETEAARRS